jgi:hypothetical protein
LGAESHHDLLRAFGAALALLAVAVLSVAVLAVAVLAAGARPDPVGAGVPFADLDRGGAGIPAARNRRRIIYNLGRPRRLVSEKRLLAWRTILSTRVLS